MRSSGLTHRRAQRLRRRLTPPEVLLWVRLREMRDDKLVFRRQHPIGPFIADFCCSTARLVVEVDGETHTEELQEEYDARRDRYLVARGFEVLRLPAAEVLKDPDGAADAAVQAALARLGR